MLLVTMSHQGLEMIDLRSNDHQPSCTRVFFRPLCYTETKKKSVKYLVAARSINLYSAVITRCRVHMIQENQ
jgi:hypothetical protein